MLRGDHSVEGFYAPPEIRRVRARLAPIRKARRNWVPGFRKLTCLGESGCPRRARGLVGCLDLAAAALACDAGCAFPLLRRCLAEGLDSPCRLREFDRLLRFRYPAAPLARGTLRCLQVCRAGRFRGPGVVGNCANL